MQTLSYTWSAGNAEHELRLVPVSGNRRHAYLLVRSQSAPRRRPRLSHDDTPVTQALWARVMGSNPSVRKPLASRGETCGAHHGAGCFLDRINTSEF